MKTLIDGIFDGESLINVWQKHNNTTLERELFLLEIYKFYFKCRFYAEKLLLFWLFFAKIIAVEL